MVGGHNLAWEAEEVDHIQVEVGEAEALHQAGGEAVEAQNPSLVEEVAEEEEVGQHCQVTGVEEG